MRIRAVLVLVLLALPAAFAAEGSRSVALAQGAGSSVGQVVGYASHGTLLRSGSQRDGAIGLPIAFGDRIRTASTGKMELLFIDATKFVVGMNSDVLIDDFVYRGSRTASAVLIQAARGSFRFVSGSGPREAYAVQTGSATLGFRGTAVDFSILRDGSTAVAVFDGGVVLCGRDRQCIEVREPCGVAVATPFGGPRPVDQLQERNQLLRNSFPYVTQQQSLGGGFRVSLGGCGSLGLVPPRSRTDGTGFTGSIRAGGGGPVISEPPDDSEPGNPGNGGPQGKAGGSPGGNDMGDDTRGRSDGGGGGRGNSG